MKTVATVRTIRTPIAQYKTYSCRYQKSGSSVEDGGMDVPDERMSHRTALETPEMHCIHFLPLHFQVLRSWTESLTHKFSLQW